MPVLVLGIAAVDDSLLLWHELFTLFASWSPINFDVVETLLLLSDRFSSSDDDESPESIWNRKWIQKYICFFFFF